MSKDNSGPAFPCSHERSPNYVGMSLRDYFAGQALAGFLANPSSGYVSHLEWPKRCYQVADAMIEAREATDADR